MQRAFFTKLFVLFLLGVCSSVQASNVMPYIISSHDFYRSSPDQLPLSEQMSAVINSPPDPIRINQLSPIRVAFLLSDSALNIKNKAIVHTFEKRMQELGIAYQILIYDKLLKGHLDNPYGAIQQDKPDYIIATALDIVQSRVVEKVLQKGISKVIYFDLSTPLANWKYHPPFMYVGFDQVKVATTLASYIDRQLPPKAPISALMLPSGYLNDVRCNSFLDAMADRNRHINDIQSVSNKQGAFEAAKRILQKTPNAFIFSCSQTISEGVVEAIAQQRKTLHTPLPQSNSPTELGDTSLFAQTNSWGVSPHELSNLSHRYVLVSSLFMWDDLVIAMAEGIKGNMEGRAEPALYVGRSSIMSPEQDNVSLHLMLQQAYRYSKVLQ